VQQAARPDCSGPGSTERARRCGPLARLRFAPRPGSRYAEAFTGGAAALPGPTSRFPLTDHGDDPPETDRQLPLADLEALLSRIEKEPIPPRLRDLSLRLQKALKEAMARNGGA